ncbi:hypothetical protein CCP2SC5_440001 [Azospirillaceae bacterium]
MLFCSLLFSRVLLMIGSKTIFRAALTVALALTAGGLAGGATPAGQG